MKNEERLIQALTSAIEGIAPSDTTYVFSACSVNAGKITLRSGDTVLVRVSVEKDDIDDYCDDLSELPDLEL